MSLELDKRIWVLTDIKSVTDGCPDCELMTKKGYFANSIFDFKELSRFCVYGEYAGWREHNQCFLCEQAGDETYYSYFLPEADLKPVEKPEKKYRPYSLNEFLNEHEIGDKITYRLKLDKQSEDFIRYKVMFCGYQFVTGNANIPGKGFINLGGLLISLQTLFNTYETPNNYLYPEVWQPFGVEKAVDKAGEL